MTLLINVENFDEHVIFGEGPFLLLCMVRDNRFIKQLKLIEAIEERYQKKLRVGVMAEESIEAFQATLQIIGSPTFLFFREGKEINRRLGIVDQEMLLDFITQCLPSNR